MNHKRHAFSRAFAALSVAVLSFLMFHNAFSALPKIMGSHHSSSSVDHADRESRRAQKLREGAIDEWDREDETSQPVPEK